MSNPWKLTGEVLHGRQLGRELGFPTANLAVPAGWGPADGVYRSRVEVDGTTYDAMSNVGCNPSVGGTQRRLETHLFGYGGAPLYGRTIAVELLERIRDERTFGSVEELRQQLEADRQQILALIER